MPTNSRIRYQGICFACNSIFDLDRPYAIGETLTCPVCGREVKVVAIWWIHRLIRLLRLGWLYRWLILTFKWLSTSILGSAIFWRVSNIYIKLVVAIIVVAFSLYSFAWTVSFAFGIIIFIFETLFSLVFAVAGFVGAVAPLFFTLVLPLVLLFGVIYLLLSGPRLSAAQAVNRGQQTTGPSFSSPTLSTSSSTLSPTVAPPSIPPPSPRSIPRPVGGSSPAGPPNFGMPVGFPGPINLGPNVILRNQNRLIALLLIIIAIMGMIIILCFLSHRTGETFEDLSKQLLGYNAVTVIVFFALFSGTKLYIDRFGYQGILRSPRSFATFLLYALLLGASNAIALVIIDSLVGDLEGDLTSNIALTLYSDMIVGVIVMLFLEKSFRGWKEDL